MKISIVWDWNGTILNDIDLCVSIANELRKSRGLPIITKEFYRDSFCFPVERYYKKLGLDLSKESFAEIAKEFVKLYYGQVSHCHLRHDVLEVIQEFHSRGINQCIISAMEHLSLKKLTDQFNITKYFQGIWGIEDHHAAGKHHIAENFFSTVENSRVFVIGDTVHDYEMAERFGATSLILTDGHQSVSQLDECENAVLIQNIQQAKERILKGI